MNKTRHLAARERSTSELYWVTRHGIRMTGMPAWGVTHSDDELWPLVALIVRFPELGEGEYERLLATAQAAGVGQGHDQGDQPAPDENHNHVDEHRHDENVH